MKEQNVLLFWKSGAPFVLLPKLLIKIIFSNSIEFSRFESQSALNCFWILSKCSRDKHLYLPGFSGVFFKIVKRFTQNFV